MGNPGLSFARVERLLLRLPNESRLFTKLLKDNDLATWSTQDELLALIFDVLHLQLWAKENETRKPSQQTKQPARYPRPYDKLKEVKSQEAKADLAKRLLEQKERLAYGSQIQGGPSGGASTASERGGSS